MHCFPFSGNTEDPEINEIDNVVDAYIKSLDNIEFAEPSNLDPILN